MDHFGKNSAIAFNRNIYYSTHIQNTLNRIQIILKYMSIDTLRLKLKKDYYLSVTEGSRKISVVRLPVKIITSQIAGTKMKFIAV